MIDEEGSRRCLLVLNRRSRQGDKYGEALVEHIRRAGFELAGDGPVAAEDLAAALREHGARLRAPRDRILVGGGDGTVNLLLADLVEAGIPVGIVPLGTANDLARTLGLPVDPEEALEVALTGHPVSIDLGRVNGRLFANVASIGLGPKISERLSERMKSGLGVVGYPLTLLWAYRDSRPFRCRVRVDDHPEARYSAIHLAVGNGRFYGGGATVARDAGIDDHRLDLFSLSPAPLWRLLLVAPWLKWGRHRDVDEVRTRSGVRIAVSTSRPKKVSADGEIVARTPAEFEVLPTALTVIVARGEDAPGLRVQGED